jgi:enoyl-CoA hydratase
MTTHETIQLTYHGPVATITFNQPDARNALPLAGMQAFAAAVEQLTADDTLRAVILTGAGIQAFCAGGDLHDLAPLTSAEDGEAVGQMMGDALLALEALPVPVIAAINGYALGGGSEIALACDLRVVDESVRFGVVHKQVALIPGWGGGQRLLRAVGYARAMDLLLTAQVLNARDMLRLGLAQRVVPDGEAYTGAWKLVQSFDDAPLDVVRAIKSLLRAGVQRPYAEALDEEHALFPDLWAADAHLEAVEKFLNRKPKE